MLQKNVFLKYEKYFVLTFFALIFFTGWSIVGDYGVTLDDYIYYTNAENTFIYVKQFFLSLLNDEIKLSSYRDKLKEFPIVYELLLVFVCKLLKINDFHQIYLTAHKLNFLLFFSSLLIFFKLAKKRFESTFISLLGITFFILSPRIFAESFYNSRDIFFMCLFIFYINSLINFLEIKSFKNILLFSFFTALLINTKILGLLPVGVFCLLYIYNFLNTKKRFLEEKNNLFKLLFFCFFFIYILWPYLWNNPVQNLFLALRDMLKGHEEIILINYYFGEYISSDMMPWHYRIVWFLISIPIIILLLFFFGVALFFKKIFKLIDLSLDNKFKLNKNNFIDVFLFLSFFLSFFIVLEFNKSKFGGWRHIYYLYPIVIYFCLYFIKHLKKNTKKVYNKLFIGLIALNLTYTFYWSTKNHPHQYLFFNFLSKNYAYKNFDLDWWGVSHKSSIEYILQDSKKKRISVYAEGFTNLKDTYLYLDKKAKDRIVLVGFQNADYVIDNKMRRVRANNNLRDNNNFELIYDLIVSNQVVASIYKKIEK